jgi:hypothetical protein
VPASESSINVGVTAEHMRENHWGSIESDVDYLTSAMSSATTPTKSLARHGETMTTAAMATYAYDQIDQARAELKAANFGANDRTSVTSDTPKILTPATCPGPAASIRQ